MQTILGAGGQIGDELARELHRAHTHDIRLVSRHPRTVNDTDQLVQGDLMDAASTSAAVVGSDIVYLTVGLPMDSALWERSFPTMMANTIAACREHQSKLVFFDNTYMSPRTPAPQTEETAFAPVGRKATVRAQIAEMVLSEIDAGTIEAAGRARECTHEAEPDLDPRCQPRHGPGGEHARCVRADVAPPDRPAPSDLRGADCRGIRCHGPSDRLHHDAVVALPCRGAFVPAVREAEELLPRYRQDNIFDCSKFATRLPQFEVTPYREGVRRLVAD